MPSRRPVNKPGNGSSVTWKYVGASALGLIAIIGAGWQTYTQSQIGEVRVAAERTKDALAEQKVDQAVTKTKVQDIDRKVDEVKKDVGDIKSTIQQILINQQQQIRDTPKR